MSNVQFTTVDRVLAKFHRDLRGTEINESDAIEWIGEALGFLEVKQIQEEAIAFLEVENYETIVPSHFNMVIQIARKKHYEKKQTCPLQLVEEVIDSCSCTTPIEETLITDCSGSVLDDTEVTYYTPYFDLRWEYDLWRNSDFYYREFVPVKLANHTFFNSIVCKERDEDLYKTGLLLDEYTIVGGVQKKLRFSFQEGLIVLSYLRTSLDKETGYPLIPDNESYISAINYYLKWKIAEWYQWNGREGFQGPLVSDLERKWLKYARQAKNYMKMPKGVDEYQELMEQTFSLPTLYKYNNFFGNYNNRFRYKSQNGGNK